MADVCQACLIQQNLLDDEDGNSLGEFGTSFHYPETERDDFGGQEEVDDGIIVVLLRFRQKLAWLLGRTTDGLHLYESADDAKGCKPKVLEWPSFGCSIKERVEEQRDVCYGEKLVSLRLFGEKVEAYRLGKADGFLGGKPRIAREQARCKPG